jgi:hypothetical protein
MKKSPTNLVKPIEPHHFSLKSLGPFYVLKTLRINAQGSPHMLYHSMSHPTLAIRSRRELQYVRRKRLCVLLVLVLAMPRNPYIPVNLNVLKGQLTTNELLHSHVGRLFSLIHMKAATFFALVAWLKHNTELQAS